MCYACNPSCGLCKPKRVISVSCPACEAPFSLRREEYLLCFEMPHRLSVLERKMMEKGGVPEPVCRECGTDLRECFRQMMPPRECLRQGILCGYPCGRSGEAPTGADDPPCPFQVPLARL